MGSLMGSLTGVLYGALVVYLGGWYLGKWTGNFSLLLFILTVATLRDGIKHCMSAHA